MKDKAEEKYIDITNSAKDNTIVYVETKTSANDADVQVKDAPVTYKLDYNGKKFSFNSPNENEQYKFEQGKLVIDRNSSINMKIELPVPVASVGIGTSNGKNIDSFTLSHRIGKSNVGVWFTHSPDDNVGGLNYTIYK